MVFIDTAGADLNTEAGRQKADDAIYWALVRVHPGAVRGQALLKVHVGEPKCTTRMRPEFIRSSVRFLRDQGAGSVVAGDSTVAYKGPRGNKENPKEDVSLYLELARRHGWAVDEAAGVPFVVLDRPSTAIAGQFEFQEEEYVCQMGGAERYARFHLAGGFAAADFVINHAHLTLHGLAGVAGCVKSIAMGCSSLTGKLLMHQSLLPAFDAATCSGCGRCIESCPEGALSLTDDSPVPIVAQDICIGCGQCETVCTTQPRAVRLEGREIIDWQRGEGSLPLRMVDYTIGLMNGKWDQVVHVLHVYTVTERCDCLDVPQQPLVRQDRGFLVGKNPFAIDLIASRLLAAALQSDGGELDQNILASARVSAEYARETYGILDKPRVEKVGV